MVKIVYSICGGRKIRQITCPKKKKLEQLIPNTRINSKNVKFLEVNIGSKISDLSHSNIFFLIYFLTQGKQKKKNKQMGLHQTKKFLHSKGNQQQNEKTTH